MPQLPEWSGQFSIDELWRTAPRKIRLLPTSALSISKTGCSGVSRSLSSVVRPNSSLRQPGLEQLMSKTTSKNGTSCIVFGLTGWNGESGKRPPFLALADLALHSTSSMSGSLWTQLIEASTPDTRTFRAEAPMNSSRSGLNETSGGKSAL